MQAWVAIFDYLMTIPIGDRITWEELELKTGCNKNSSRAALNRAKEELVKNGKALSLPEATGFTMVPVSMQQERVFWPGQCPQCTMQGLPERYACSHQEQRAEPGAASAT